MKLLFLLLAGSLFTSSIYSVSFTSIGGSAVSFRSYQGKKLLLVNIATSGPRASQLAELQTLQNQYKDSLVVIGFPSNAFGHEGRDNAGIQSYCQSQGITFLLSQKVVLTGSAMPMVYQWLTKQSENGVMNQVVKDDFQKYLIDQEGNLIGVFAGSLSPLDSTFINALTTN